MKLTHALPIVSTLALPFVLSCPPPPPETSNALVLRARAACAGIAARNRPLCEEAVQRLALDHTLYRVSEAQFHERATERQAMIASFARSMDGDCRRGRELACTRAANARTELTRLAAAEIDPAERLRLAERRYQLAVDALPALAALLRNRIAAVCRRLPGPRLECVRLSTMVAYFDSTLSGAMLADIDRLVEVYGIDRRAEILMSCGADAWGGATTDELGTTSVASFLASLETDAATTEQVLSRCPAIAAGSLASGGYLDAGGFSGLTGFDPWGGLAACGFDIAGGAITTERMIEQFTAMSEAFRSECPRQPGSTISENGGDTSGDPPPDPPPDQDETVEDNGDGTEMVCNDHGCYVRYQEPSTASSHATESDLQTTCTDDGTCTTEVSGLDANNNPIEVKEIVHPDGTRETVIKGDGRSMYGIETPDGHRYWMECRGSQCRDTSAGPGEPIGNPWDMTWEEYQDWIDWLEQQQNIGVGDCIDGPCMTCGQYSEFMWNLKQGCATFGSTSSTCQSYLRESECCANPNAAPVDPRVVLPNPGGGFACYGAMDVDEQTEVCRLRCTVADGEDCEANCMTRAPAQIEYDMMDVICTMAISEDCFTGSTGMPDIVEPSPVCGGAPPPVDLVERRVLPARSRLGTCDPTTIDGCGEVERDGG